MFFRNSLAVVAAALLSGTAFASNEKPAANGKEAAPAKEKQICRSIKLTGSRMPVRDCKTAKKWADDAYKNDGSELQVVTKGSSLQGQDAAATMPN